MEILKLYWNTEIQVGCLHINEMNTGMNVINSNISWLKNFMGLPKISQSVGEVYV
jgi:hypothetical protein